MKLISLLPFLEAIECFKLISSFRSTKRWQLMSTSQWHQSTVISNSQDAACLKRLVIKTSPEVAASYVHPGQYVQIRATAGKPGFYAVCSPPSPADDLLTFLVKETETNHYISRASSGAELEMSLAQGKGFPIEEYFQRYKFDFPVTNILMLACGSGIAPVAAAIESGLLGLGKANFNSLFQSAATLYLGSRDPAHQPLADKTAAWQSAGVTVVPVYSQAAGELPASSRRGYVQEALRADGVSVPRNTGALLCGPRGMVEDTKKLLLEAGVFEGRILLNF